jgi:hypothetical protein
VLRVTECVDAREPEAFGDIHHRAQGFGREPLAPGVTSQHVAGGGPVRRFDAQPRATDEPLLAP